MTNQMPHLDPEMIPGFEQLALAHPDHGGLEIGDWRSRRRQFDDETFTMAAWLPLRPEVERRDVIVDGVDAPIRGRWYIPQQTTGAAVLWLHGGGMISGSVDAYDRTIARHAEGGGVCIFAIDYILAPDAQHPHLLEECAVALRWMREKADDMGIDADRIGVIGDSAGGGLAAGLCLMLRDRGADGPARQFLIYPMLDHRTDDQDGIPDEVLGWAPADNITGWSAYLGDAEHDAETLGWASPAVADSVEGLPPAFIEVAQLDIFARENLLYGQRLMSAGVPVELHSWPSVPHGFDWFAPEAVVTTRALRARIEALRDL